MFSSSFKNHIKSNLRIALPVSFSQVGQVMVGVVDSIMVGQLGKEPLAAAAVGNSIFALPLLFGIGISYGATPLVAAFAGEKNFKNAGEVFKHSLLVNFIAGFSLFLLFYVFSFLIPLLNQPKDVVELTVPYFNIILISIIPVMVFQSFKQFAEGLSLTKQAMFISIGGNLLNIFFNYVLIYGKFGFPSLGLNGAAIATLFSRIIMAVAMGFFVFYSSHIRPYLQDFTLRSFYKKYFIQILHIGVPSAFQFMFEVTAFSFAAIMMGWIGTRELAAHQIAISLASLTYMFATGLSAGAVVRVGNFFGAKDKLQLREAGFSSFLIAALFMGICGAIFIIFNKTLPSFYIQDVQVIKVASSLMVVAAFFQISDGAQVVGLGALRGIKDVKIPTIITFLAYWVIGLPTGFLLGKIFEFGAIGIWIGLLLGLTVSALLLFFRFNYKSKSLMF